MEDSWLNDLENIYEKTKQPTSNSSRSYPNQNSNDLARSACQHPDVDLGKEPAISRQERPTSKPQPPPIHSRPKTPHMNTGLPSQPTTSANPPANTEKRFSIEVRGRNFKELQEKFQRELIPNLGGEKAYPKKEYARETKQESRADFQPPEQQAQFHTPIPLLQPVTNAQNQSAMRPNQTYVPSGLPLPQQDLMINPNVVLGTTVPLPVAPPPPSLPLAPPPPPPLPLRNPDPLYENANLLHLNTKQTNAVTQPITSPENQHTHVTQVQTQSDPPLRNERFENVDGRRLNQMQPNHHSKNPSHFDIIQHTDWILQYIKTGHKNRAAITRQELLHHRKYFVGFIGPPGSGKSTLCNTSLYIQQNKKYYVFTTSGQDESFTKGLWILSPEAKMQMKDCDWEVMDFEGFEPDDDNSWKLTMILAALAEIVVFCNREPRATNIYKALEIFEKGREQTAKLNMKPATKQAFVIITPRCFEKNGSAVQEKFQNKLKNIKVEVIVVPDIVENDELKLPFNEHIVNAVKHMISKFQFDPNAQAAASKAEQVYNLLEAFNKHDFNKCKQLAFNYFKADCVRIYDEALCKFKGEHMARAQALQVSSLETSLEEFANSADWVLKVDFTTSVYYNPDFDKYTIETYGPKINLKQETLALYQSHYLVRIGELRQKQNLLNLQQVAEESEKKLEEAKKRSEDNERQYSEMILEQERRLDELKRTAETKLTEKLKQLNLQTEEEYEKQKQIMDEQAKRFFAQKEEEQRQIQNQRELEIQKSRELMEIEQKEQLNLRRKEKFNTLVQQEINNAIQRLQTAISNLSEYRPLFSPNLLDPWSHYINTTQFDDDEYTDFEPDWSPFENKYKALRDKLESDWNEQIAKAKWKAPVTSVGDLTCKNGCKLNPNVVLCGRCTSKYEKQLFWCDGPNNVVICQGGCAPFKINKGLICTACNADANCEVRPSDYMP